MDDDAELIRKPSPEELADVAAMHAANRAAWDEASERYEGWLDEAVALIRSGGTNLFGVEIELIGDLHGRCRRAIHLQCAGGRDTLSLWNQGADEVVGVDFSPRMLDLAARLSAATGAPARWVLADVLDTPHDLDGSADLVYTGRGSLIWLADLDAWAAVDRAAAVASKAGSSCSRDIPRSGCSTPTPTATGSPPTTTTSAGPRRRRAGRPNTSTGCRSPNATRAGSSPGPGRSVRSSPRCSGRTCVSRRWPSIRSTGGAGTPTYAPRSAGGSRCRSRWSAAREPELRRGRDRRIGRPGSVGRARRPRSPSGRSTRRCADRASPGRRSATGPRARRDRRVNARNGRASAA